MAPEQCALYVVMSVKCEISELGERCNVLHCTPDDIPANRVGCDRQWVTGIRLRFSHRYRDRSTGVGLSVYYIDQ